MWTSGGCNYPKQRYPWLLLLLSLLTSSTSWGKAEKVYDTEYSLSRTCFVNENTETKRTSLSKPFTKVVQFTYSVETTTRRTAGNDNTQETENNKFLQPLQEMMLDAATDASIGCSRQGRRSLLLSPHSTTTRKESFRNLEEEDSIRERSVDAVMRSFNAVPDSDDKQDQDKKWTYCHRNNQFSECAVFNAVLSLTASDHSVESSMSRDVLTRLMQDMEDDRYVTPSIPEIVAVTYHGPDPSTVASNSSSSRRRSAESLLLLTFKATVLVALVGLFYVSMTVIWHRKGSGLEATTEPAALLREDMVYEQENRPIASRNNTRDGLARDIHTAASALLHRVSSKFNQMNTPNDENKPIASDNDTRDGGAADLPTASTLLNRVSLKFNRNRADTPDHDWGDEVMLYDDYNSDDNSSASENTIHRSNKSSAASGLGEAQVHPMEMSESFLVHLT